MIYTLTLLFCFQVAPGAAPECFIVRQNLPNKKVCEPLAREWEEVYRRAGAKLSALHCTLKFKV